MKVFSINLNALKEKFGFEGAHKSGDFLLISHDVEFNKNSFYNEESVLFKKSLLTSLVTSTTFFKDENVDVTEQRSNEIFEIYAKKDGVEVLTVEKFSFEPDSRFKLIVHNKNGLKNFMLCHADDDCNEDDLPDWVGVSLSSFPHIFLENAICSINYDYLPNFINKNNIVGLLNLLGFKVTENNIVGMNNMVTVAEQERERKYGDKFWQYKLKEDEYHKIFPKTKVSYALFQIFESFFNENSYENENESDLNSYLNEFVKKIQAVKSNVIKN